MSRAPLVITLTAAAIVAALVLAYRSNRSERDTPSAAVARSGDVAPREAAAAPPASTPPAVADRPAPRRAPAPKAAGAAATLAPAETAPAAGTLVIVSDVAGAQVFLDREFVGPTPFTVNNVTPGTHQLNVSAAGYDAQVQTIDVSPGTHEISVKFREVRLDVALDVVHKHRLGSCRGRLVATPRGLRYETTDPDDGFSATLTELETFQIDYLTKNLRIQARHGKRYDFTDPAGSADRLFVFHRDVDRARERLRKGDVPAAQ